YSFRGNPKVRAQSVSLLAWCGRCPKTRQDLFVGRYDERSIAPINTAMKDYARLLDMNDDDEWIVPPDAPEYAQETGICLSDGGLRARPRDISPRIDASALCVRSDFSLHRAYMIFRTMGLRHLLVVDVAQARPVGIVTRHDLVEGVPHALPPPPQLPTPRSRDHPPPPPPR
ncbi:MAG: CBS domain-containing protein, partial [Pseudomonadota bacterium]|nr:CBS domain-containing protein [Pseudomonadota bacterium]